MARPREFDEDLVLEKAARVFWAHGFEGSSLADLCGGTGLAKGSLYKAFGDKRGLYLRALERYMAEGRSHLHERLREADSGLAGLESWLRTIGSMASRGGPNGGCFAVNATVELGPSDPEVRSRLAQHEGLVETAYAQALKRAQREGDVRADLDPDEGARFVAVLIHGLQALGRGRLRPDEVDTIVEAGLRSLRT